MATSIIREDGTGDYTTISAWEAGEQRDLVAAGDGERAQIEGSWTSAETGGVDIDGWTTNATHYIEIEAVGDARHNGQWDDTAYRMVYGGSYAWIPREPYTRSIGVQVSNNGSTSTPSILPNGADQLYKEMICRGPTFCFADRCTYQNLLVYDIPAGHGDPYGVRLRNDDCTLQNCTLIGGTDGVRWQTGGGTLTIENVIGYGHSGSALVNGVGGTTAGDTNADEDGTFPGSNNVLLTSDPFVDSANDDYHLASGSDPVDAGTDLSADFTTDIDGETRAGTWDIGADEIVSGGTTLTPNAVSVSLTPTDPSQVQTPSTSVVALSLPSSGANFTPDAVTVSTGFADWIQTQTPDAAIVVVTGQDGIVGAGATLTPDAAVIVASISAPTQSYTQNAVSVSATLASVSQIQTPGEASINASLGEWTQIIGPNSASVETGGPSSETVHVPDEVIVTTSLGNEAVSRYASPAAVSVATSIAEWTQVYTPDGVVVSVSAVDGLVGGGFILSPNAAAVLASISDVGRIQEPDPLSVAASLEAITQTQTPDSVETQTSVEEGSQVQTPDQASVDASIDTTDESRYVSPDPVSVVSSIVEWTQVQTPDGVNVIGAVAAPSQTQEPGSVIVAVSAQDGSIISVVVDIRPPYEAQWVDPTREGMWVDPNRTAEWD